MCNSLLIEKFDSLNELLDQCSTELRLKSTFLGDEVEELSFCELKYNQSSLFSWFILKLNSCIGIWIDDADQMFKFEFFEKLHLSFEGTFLIKSVGIDLERIEFFAFTTQIDTEDKKLSTWLDHPIQEENVVSSRWHIGDSNTIKSILTWYCKRIYNL